MSKIYDTFCFFNELDLLEIRLKYLNDIVDFFVINECTLTQSGEKKPLYYLENKERFKDYHHKIIHNMVDDVPVDFLNKKYTDNIDRNKILDILDSYTHYPKDVWRYGNETYQKECILLTLRNCQDDDIIMFSDVDEIPNKETIKNLSVPVGSIIHLNQDMMQYYVNVKKREIWYGTKVFNYRYIKNLDVGLNGMRMDRNKGTIDNNQGGWHLTFLGGVEKVKEKIRAYGHQEFNNDYILNNIEERIKNNQDIFFRPDSIYMDVSMDVYPTDLRELLEQYPQFIKS